MAKKKKDINLDALNFKPILEEAVVCSRLGRTIASFGSTLTGREKANAKLVFSLLAADKHVPEDTEATAHISTEKKSKKYTYAQAVNWFAENYPREAEPLLAKLKEEYDSRETSVLYGLKQGQNLPDDYYVKILSDILEIPKQEAVVMYHGVIKPHLERLEEVKGLVSLVMK